MDVSTRRPTRNRAYNTNISSQLLIDNVRASVIAQNEYQFQSRVQYEQQQYQRLQHQQRQMIEKRFIYTEPRHSQHIQQEQQSQLQQQYLLQQHQPQYIMSNSVHNSQQGQNQQHSKRTRSHPQQPIMVANPNPLPKHHLHLQSSQPSQLPTTHLKPSHSTSPTSSYFPTHDRVGATHSRQQRSPLDHYVAQQQQNSHPHNPPSFAPTNSHTPVNLHSTHLTLQQQKSVLDRRERQRILRLQQQQQQLAQLPQTTTSPTQGLAKKLQGITTVTSTHSHSSTHQNNPINNINLHDNPSDDNIYHSNSLEEKQNDNENDTQNRAKSIEEELFGLDSPLESPNHSNTVNINIIDDDNVRSHLLHHDSWQSHRQSNQNINDELFGAVSNLMNTDTGQKNHNNPLKTTLDYQMAQNDLLDSALRNASQAQQISATSQIRLHEQSEQINRMNTGLNTLQSSLHTTGKVLDGVNSFTTGVMNIIGLNNGGKLEDIGQIDAKTCPEHNSSEKSNMLQGFRYEVNTDDFNAKLDQLDHIVGDIKHSSQTMNSQLKSHNIALQSAVQYTQDAQQRVVNQSNTLTQQTRRK